MNKKKAVTPNGIRALLPRTAWAGVCLMSLVWAGCSESTKTSIEVECKSASDCPSGTACWNGTCRELPSDVRSDLGDTEDLPDFHVNTDGVFTDFPITEGGQGWPCTSVEECEEGFLCLAITAKKSICVGQCLDNCPEGYSCRGLETSGGTVDFRCLPEGGRLCEPCTTDVSCLGQGNLCINVGDTLVCGVDCSESECPAGYECKSVKSVEDKSGSQCVPISGTCACTPDSAGVVRTCFVQNDFGTCFGEEVCQEDGSLTACSALTPAQEVCDNADNDCDGQIDEELAPVECQNENEWGVCTGMKLCIAGVGEVCSAPTAAQEMCDYVDNDCDGDVDEEFKDTEGEFGLLENCGACGNSCVGMFANATEVACVSAEGAQPDCQITKCGPGFVLANPKQCMPAFHHLCEPCTDNTSCIGMKDLCLQFGATDTQKFCGRDCDVGNEYGEDCPEGYACTPVTVEGVDYKQCLPAAGTCDCKATTEGLKKPCMVTNEFGSCYGLAVCNPSVGWENCTAGTPEQEICDGTDNNCNGTVDEVDSVPCEVTNEWGTCYGSRFCVFGTGEVCTAGTPSQEVCDGVDNDCDGDVDEDFGVNIKDELGNLLTVQYSLTNEHCGACFVSCQATPPALTANCVPDGASARCEVQGCQEGYYAVDGRFCVPIPQASLCLPCSDNSACPGPKDLCVPYNSGDRCARDCDVGSIYGGNDPLASDYCTGETGVQSCCPSGYLCQEVGENKQCLRINNTCDCNDAVREIPCTTTNEVGTCMGVERCDPVQGWQACNALLAGPEVCNGLDDDCDGYVDSLDSSISLEGLEGYPNCQNVSSVCSGQWICRNSPEGFAWECTAPAPVDETCDGRDNDCDSLVDEEFKNQAGEFDGIENCGQCGLNCLSMVANLATDIGGVPLPDSVACEKISGSYRCVPQSCAPGYYPFPTTGTPVTCLKAEATNCLPCNADSDCLGIGQHCLSIGSDAQKYCAQRCDSAAPFVCNGEIGAQDCCPAGFQCGTVAGVPAGEAVCLPLNGSCACSEFTVGLARPCSVTTGGNTCFGAEFCKSGPTGYDWGTCEAVGYVEVCDGLDNDCDNQIDEGYLVDGVYATDQNCGGCGVNCLLQWSDVDHHADGLCDVNNPGGPVCALGSCFQDGFVPLGAACEANSDCVGDATSTSCMAVYGHCAKRCNSAADCPSGVCHQGMCAHACLLDSECEEGTYCLQGFCGDRFDFVNLDSLEGNGCECAAALDPNGVPVFDEPDWFATVPAGGERYVDLDCDGIDGDAETALFVSAGADFGDGSLEAPFGTLAEALAQFELGEYSHILVSSGVYEERVVLTEGVRVFGGYSPDFLNRDVVLYPSVIRLATPEMDGSTILPGVVVAEGIVTETVFAGFTVEGYDVPSSAANAGQASFTVVLNGCSSALHFVNNRVEGGRGAQGYPGISGSVGALGTMGGNGIDSTECTNQNCTGGQSLPGGSGGSAAVCGGSSAGCTGMSSDGGEQQQTQPDSGYCTFPANAGGETNIYQSGPAALCKYDCTVEADQENGGIGSKGTDGSAGNKGSGCTSGLGTISAEGVWMGATGTGGSQGTPGEGGKGGAAGARVLNQKSSSCTIGNRVGDMGGSGGGGGGGGCGGTGGAPGGPGGASVALLVYGSAPASLPDVTGNVVRRGFGGSGGRGGAGGAGGAGGPGGYGGVAKWPAWCAGSGGNGGRGGDGGPGGGGGGGCGGPSVGFWVVGAPATAYQNANSFALPDTTQTGGAPGLGGPSVAPTQGGTDGSQGPSHNVLSL